MAEYLSHVMQNLTSATPKSFLIRSVEDETRKSFCKNIFKHTNIKNNILKGLEILMFCSKMLICVIIQYCIRT